MSLQGIWNKDFAGQADDEDGSKVAGGSRQECEGGNQTAGHRGVQMGGPSHQTHTVRTQTRTGV